MRFIFCISIIFLLFESSLSAQTEHYLILDDLINRAVANNPQLHALRHQTQAVKEQIRQVTAWDAPQIGIEFYQTPVQSFPVPTKKNMETDYFIQQTFPWPGKLSAMSRIAQNNASVMNEQYHAFALNIVYNLKSFYYRLYMIQSRINVNLEKELLLKKMSQAAQSLYETGTGKQTDLLLLQIELSRLANEKTSLEEEKKIMESMINTLLNQSADESLGSIEEPVLSEIHWNYEQLTALAEDHRPELKAVQYTIALNRSEVEAAQRQRYPDIMVRGMYKNMSNTDKDFWSMMLSVNLPMAFWSKSKYQSRIAEFEQHQKHAEMELMGLKNTVYQEVFKALIGLQSSSKQALEIKKNLIPKTEQTFDTELSLYLAGKTSFIMLMESYQALIESKLEYQTALINAKLNEAQLEQSVGLNLTEIHKKLD